MTMLRDADYGTPTRQGTTAVSLTIDGRVVRVPVGTSVMAAARQHDVQIPKLCATDSLEAFGSCRLCLVEIDGRRGTPASCTTLAEEGLVVHTQSARLKALRLHGRYLGYMRQLKAKAKAEVRALRAKKGVRAAIKRARKLAAESARP